MLALPNTWMPSAIAHRISLCQTESTPSKYPSTMPIALGRSCAMTLGAPGLEDLHGLQELRRPGGGKGEHDRGNGESAHHARDYASLDGFMAWQRIPRLEAVSPRRTAGQEDAA